MEGDHGKNVQCTFYIVRHGETEANVKKIIQGHSDYPLTEKGRVQIKNLADKLQSIHFDAIFSSDLLRAKQTAEVIALERKLIVNTSHLLRERKFGKYEGKKLEAFQEENKELLGQLATLSHDDSKRIKFAPDIETNEELINRFITFLQEIAVAYAGKTVLVVTHGGIIWALLRHLGHGAAANVIENTACFELLSDGTTLSIKEIK